MINLLVTGGAGFIGSNFINYIFKSKKYKIYNLDNLYYCASKNNIEKEIRDSKDYMFIKGNLCSEDLINHMLTTYKIEQVIHFAAQSHVQTSFTDSIQYSKDNVLGTHNLLEIARLYCSNLERFIHCSTDEVYGESLIDFIFEKLKQC